MSHVWDPNLDGGAYVNFSQVDALIKQRNFFYDISSLNILPKKLDEYNQFDNSRLRNIEDNNMDDLSSKSSHISIPEKEGSTIQHESDGKVGIGSVVKHYVKRRKAEPLFSDDFALLKAFLNIRERRREELEQLKLKEGGAGDSDGFEDNSMMASYEVIMYLCLCI